MHAGAPGEFDIIARYFSRRSSRPDVVLGVGDDAALLNVPSGSTLVAAVDTIVEGVHFPVGTDARDIGYRAMAVNLSDMAAMGAAPAWALLSLSLPKSEPAWLEGFAAGLYELADRHNVALVGGDTVRGPLVLTVQILGLLPAGKALRRSGAKPGDLVYVSGVPGEAAAGLAVIQKEMAGGDAVAFLQQRFLRPEPRVALGRALLDVASAAMDVSDGLLTDLGKLCRASGCAASLDLESLPSSPQMHSLFDDAACDRFALAGGDDYELLFTVPPDRVASIVRCTRIGRILAAEESPGAVHCFRYGQQVDVDAPGFDHFSGG